MIGLSPVAILTLVVPALLAAGAIVFALAAGPCAPFVSRAAARLENPRATRTALALAMALYVAWLGSGSLARHWRLETETYDLGNVEQATWNTLHGRFFRMTTDPEYEMNLQHGTRFPELPDHRWAFHVEPILLAMLPIYAALPRAETLLMIQTLLLAAGAIPAYMAARALLGRRAAGVAFAGLYLLNPNLHRGNLFDVHPLAFAAPFLLGAFALARTGRPRAAFASALAALACREDMAPAVAILGLIWIAGGSRRLGGATLAAAAIWGALVFGAIMPQVNPQGSIFAKRFVLASGPRDLMRIIVTEPGVVIWFLTRPARLAYEAYLLLPFAFLPLAGPHLLLLAAPGFATIVFSAHDESGLLRGLYHYHAALVPGMLLGAAWALSRLWRRGDPARREKLRLAVVVAMLFLTVATAIAWKDPAWAWPALDRRRLAAVDRARRLIPPDAGVAASYVLGPHVARRRNLYTLYSPNHAKADYLFLADCRKEGCDGMPRARYEAEIAAFRADPAWRLLFEGEGILLLGRSRADGGAGHD